MLLGWRDVPTDNPRSAKRQADRTRLHAGVHRPQRRTKTEDDFERRLYILRSRSRRRSISAATCGLRLLPGLAVMPDRDLQGHVPRRPARKYYPDLHERISRRLALVHQRFSTNTPGLVAGASYRMIAITANQHAARQRQLDGGASGLGAFELYGKDISDYGRFPMRASPTRLLRQRRSNSWCRAATRCRMPS